MFYSYLMAREIINSTFGIMNRNLFARLLTASQALSSWLESHLTDKQKFDRKKGEESDDKKQKSREQQQKNKEWGEDIDISFNHDVLVSKSKYTKIDELDDITTPTTTTTTTPSKPKSTNQKTSSPATASTKQKTTTTTPPPKSKPNTQTISEKDYTPSDGPSKSYWEEMESAQVTGPSWLTEQCELFIGMTGLSTGFSPKELAASVIAALISKQSGILSKL